MPDYNISSQISLTYLKIIAMQKFHFTLLKTMKLFLLFSFISIFFVSCKKEDLVAPIPTGPTSGDVMFWTSSDLNCGNITVAVGSSVKLITGFYNTSIPTCGAASTASFTLSPGTYSYAASCTGKTWNGTFTVTAGGCSSVQLTAAGGGGGGGTTTGQGMFWIASDLGCGNITVVCNGTSRTISSVYGTAPSCGASGTATFDLSPGTYAYTASCSGKNWSGTITTTAGGCQRVQLTSSGGGTTTGQGMFWIASDLGCGNITVVCNGISRTISSVYGTTPSCGASGTATFDLSPGTYAYTASCSGKNWSGTITITPGGCQRVQLTSSGGGTTTGQGMFWTAFDRGCGNITVVCNGISKIISGYSTTGVPACGTAGCATFDLSPGTYSYSASCTGGWNASGTITITAGGCTRIQFT